MLDPSRSETGRPARTRARLRTVASSPANTRASASTPQHYAFLVGEDTFEAALSRIEAAWITYYAAPDRTEPGRANRLFGGRGVYFEDPDGHNMEIMTRPYSR